MKKKTYFKTSTIGDVRIQASETLKHSTRRRAEEYRDAMQKLGLYSWVFRVGEQGTIVPP